MKTVVAQIRGTSPLLVNRFSEDAEQAQATRKIVSKKVVPREDARARAYIAQDGTFFFSAFAIPGCMGSAGANHKSRGSRKSLRWVVPSAVRMTSDHITILNGVARVVNSGGRKGNLKVATESGLVFEAARDFEVDSRPVTIPSTKGRVMRYRPRWDVWGARFELVVNDDLIGTDMAHQLLTEGGRDVGVGDFRPEKRGPFGCFRVISWDENEMPDEPPLLTSV